MKDSAQAQEKRYTVWRRIDIPDISKLYQVVEECVPWERAAGAYSATMTAGFQALITEDVPVQLIDGRLCSG